MPRNVRPAWLDTTANDHTRGAGPRRRDGALSATLYLRENGSVSPVLDLDAGALGGGTSHATARIGLRESFVYLDPRTHRPVCLPGGTILTRTVEQ